MTNEFGENDRPKAQKSVGVTRRGFLKATAATAGTAVLGGSLSGCARGKGRNRRCGVCRGNHCDGSVPKQLLGRLLAQPPCARRENLRVSPYKYPEPEFNRICSKGFTHMFRTYSAERVKYPMRRVEGTERGAGEWERISWEEAISEIAAKIKEAQQQYGETSLLHVRLGLGQLRHH